MGANELIPRQKGTTYISENDAVIDVHTTFRLIIVMTMISDADYSDTESDRQKSQRFATMLMMLMVMSQ